MNGLVKNSELFGLYDRLPTGVFVVNDEGVVIFWNHYLSLYTQYSKNEVLDRSIFELFPKLALRKYKARIKQVFDFGMSVILSGQLHDTFLPTDRINKKVGHNTTINCFVSDDQTYAIFSITDITEELERIRQYKLLKAEAETEVKLRVQTEGHLKEANLFINSVVCHVPSVIFSVDYQLKKTFISPNVAAILGIGHSDLLNAKDGIKSYVVKDDLALFLESRKKLFSGSHTKIEYKIRNAQGAVVHIREKARSTVNSSGKILRIDGYVENITSAKQVENELKKKDSIYRLLSENSTDLVCLHDTDGRFVFVSNSCEKVLGFTHDELLGEHYAKVVAPEWIERLKKQIQHSLSSDIKSSFQLEYEALSAKGEKLWLETYVKFIFDKGEITDIQSSTRDISQRKSFEAELIEAKEIAEKAAFSKAQFMSVMSHEIRTPLNAVIGMSHVLLKENPRADQESNLKALLFSAENLLNLVNDILDFSKIEAGKLNLISQPIHLVDLLGNIHKSFLPKAQEKKVGFYLDIDVSTPQVVKSDSMRISQILNNLISNAIKFTDVGEVRLSVSTDQRGNVRFKVSDTGIGIPKNKERLVFESFQQASTSTADKYGGTGLGLTITKYLVEIFKGSLSLDSIEGVGTVFEVTLPLEILTNAELAVSQHTGKVIEANVDLKGKKALLVEDIEINAVIAGKFLDMWGMHWERAYNGKEAVDMVQKGGYDVILMDLQMPIMDGREAAKLIREQIKLSIPIIALSAASEQSINADIIHFDDFIPKPFHPNQFYETLAQVFNTDMPQKSLYYLESSLNDTNARSSMSGLDLQLNMSQLEQLNLKSNEFEQFLNYLNKNIKKVISALDRFGTSQQLQDLKSSFHDLKASTLYFNNKPLVSLFDQLNEQIAMDINPDVHQLNQLKNRLKELSDKLS